MRAKARNFAAPPPDVTAEQLFALLVDPAPRAPLAYRLPLPDGEDVPLEVRPLPALEMGAALATAALVTAPELRGSRYTRELTSRCLWTPEGRAFGSADEVGVLDPLELRELADQVLDALATIGPTYARSDWQAWQEILTRGAKEPTNRSTAISLAGCADYGHGAVVFRPEWFWGVPRCQLLDGHWMVYRAARKAWVDDETPAPRSIAEALQQAQMRRS